MLALAILAAVLYTHSREGYVMLAVTALFLAGKQYRGLILLGLLVWLASPILLPESVNERFSNTLHQIRVARTDSPGGNSLTARLYAWRYRWNGWFVKHPVQGNGIGSIPFTVDNQYLLTLVEVGIIGFGLFLWLLARLWKTLSQASRALAGTFPGVLAIGALGALVALLVQRMGGDLVCDHSHYGAVGSCAPSRWQRRERQASCRRIAMEHRPLSTG